MERVEIPLTHGKITVIDAGDLPLVQSYAWRATLSDDSWWYARTTIGLATGRRIECYMHRLIMAAPPGVEVDHRDHNGLNNRRANLRLASRQQNQCNLRKPRGGRSRYKGVTLHVRHYRLRHHWSARICHYGKHCHLGYYATEEEAAMAYDRAAKELFGDFAVLNFPGGAP